MIKRQELADPQSCLNRADGDKLIFVLLERDIAAPATIRFWVLERIRLGKNVPDDPQIREALACADRMERAYRDSGAGYRHGRRDAASIV